MSFFFLHNYVYDIGIKSNSKKSHKYFQNILLKIFHESIIKRSNANLNAIFPLIAVIVQRSIF